MVLTSDVQTVTIECPGVTCRSRFSESLDKNIVAKNDWVHSVNITYVNRVDQKDMNPVWGDTAKLRFTIDRKRKPWELAEVLVDSGYYYGTEGWTLVERTSLSKLKRSRASRDTIALGIKVPEKVSEVFWSVQSEVCTIQVSFPSLPDGDTQPEHPPTQVWLLKSDGTTIATVSEPTTMGTSMAGHTTESAIYTFPQTAHLEAIAVVVSIDGQLFTEKLSSLKK